MMGSNCGWVYLKRSGNDQSGGGLILSAIFIFLENGICTLDIKSIIQPALVEE